MTSERSALTSVSDMGVKADTGLLFQFGLCVAAG